MKIVICTTPIRPVPTEYPPFGSMAIIQALRSAGHDPCFLDIDGLRPTFEQVTGFFRREQPDIVGISAVVSTAYAYTKNLCLALRKVAPRAKIVVGGNLAASAEILHRKCTVDFCVIGEGEWVIVNLLGYLEAHQDAPDYVALGNIRGITYLRGDGQVEFTGYEAAIAAKDLFEPDFSMLEKYSRIENYITDPLSRLDFSQDPRTYESHRAGKRAGTVEANKGCVARCTFCHRWDKGFRAIPVDKVVRRVRYLLDNYNVGFIHFGDENFGSDRRQLDELIKAIAPLDILYRVGGMRCRSVDPELLKRMRDSGCVAIYYGMETGSPDILQAMEKNSSLEQNINAARWTHEAGVYTVYQLVLGMPGETEKTITETIGFLKSIAEFSPKLPSLSINYIQALPGTPVYEYARAKGLIGRGLDDEEEYLLMVSDTNAKDDTKCLNFTDYDYLTVQSWRRRIYAEVVGHYYRHHRLPTLGAWECIRQVMVPWALHVLWPRRFAAPRFGGASDGRDYTQGGYFNVSSDKQDLAYSSLYRFRGLLIWGAIVVKELRRLPPKEFIARLWKLVLARLRKSKAAPAVKSLRQVMKEIVPEPLSMSEKSARPLREGR